MINDSFANKIPTKYFKMIIKSYTIDDHDLGNIYLFMHGIESYQSLSFHDEKIAHYIKVLYDNIFQYTSQASRSATFLDAHHRQEFQQALDMYMVTGELYLTVEKPIVQDEFAIPKFKHGQLNNYKYHILSREAIRLPAECATKIQLKLVKEVDFNDVNEVSSLSHILNEADVKKQKRHMYTPSTMFGGKNVLNNIEKNIDTFFDETFIPRIKYLNEIKNEDEEVYIKSKWGKHALTFYVGLINMETEKKREKHKINIEFSRGEIE